MAIIRTSYLRNMGLALMLFTALFTASAQAQDTLSTEDLPHSHSGFFLQPDDPYSHFLFRLDENDQPRRVFGLGVYTPRLHPRHFQKYDPFKNWVPDDELVSSLRENLSVLYNRFNYFRGDVRRPAILDSLGTGRGFEIGGGHLAWWLRDRYATTESGWLSAQDQASLAERIDIEALHREYQYLTEYAGHSNLIIDTFDEPEHGGYGDGWYFSRETQRLMYEEARSFAPVALGLGPVGDHRGRGRGNQMLWSLTHGQPEGNQPPDRQIRQTSLSWQDVLQQVLDYYDGAFDILHLNSYAFTNAEPRRMGEIVSEMLHHPTINREKAVWPWISAENFRYGNNIDETMTTIRAQAFSAIANDASGLMFYPDVRVRGQDGTFDERIWEHTYHLIKEINFWRPVLELGERKGIGKTDDTEWIHFTYNNYDVVFLVNHGRRDATLEVPGSMEINGRESGVWFRNMNDEDDPFRKFRFPANLGFHSDKSGDENRWSLSGSGEGYQSLLLREGISPKNGEAVLSLSASRAVSVVSETTFDLLTGSRLEAGIWFKKSGSAGDRHAAEDYPVLTLEIWSDDERIQTFSSSVKTANGLYDSNWVRLITKTGELPSHATHARLTIGSTGPGSWLIDDAFLKMELMQP